MKPAESSDEPEKSTPKSVSAMGWTIRGLVLAVFVATFVVLYINFRHLFSLDYLAEQESTLLAYRDQHPLLVYVIAFLMYVAVTGLSLPGALVLSVAYAWYFTFWPALILISFASTLGATIAFLLSRYLFRDAIQNRFGDRLSTFNESLEREGAFYLFTLRTIPAVPFFVINAVMGLTNIKTWTFWWVSQLGMLPGTILFVYTGSSFPRLKDLAQQGLGGILTPQLMIAFVLLGIFPLAVKKLVGWWRSKHASQTQPKAEEN
jgi:uncharacterized membrane protein YdjX (TVP38/TMEM64 family)